MGSACRRRAWSSLDATHDGAAYDGTAHDETPLRWGGWSCTRSRCTRSTGNNLRHVQKVCLIEKNVFLPLCVRPTHEALSFSCPPAFSRTCEPESQEAQGPPGRSGSQGLLITTTGGDSDLDMMKTHLNSCYGIKKKII